MNFRVGDFVMWDIGFGSHYGHISGLAMNTAGEPIAEVTAARSSETGEYRPRTHHIHFSNLKPYVVKAA